MKLSPEDLAEKAHIQANPDLKTYYRNIQQGFNEAFQYSSLVTQGRFTTGSGVASQSLNALATIGSSIPFASLVFSTASKVVDSYQGAKEVGQNQHLKELINSSSDPIDAAVFSERIALRLTISSEENVMAAARENKDPNLLTRFTNFFRRAGRMLDVDATVGLLGREKSNVELLALGDCASALGYVLEGTLEEDLKDAKQSPDQESEAARNITKIVEAVTKRPEIRLMPAVVTTASTTSPQVTTLTRPPAVAESKTGPSSTRNKREIELQNELERALQLRRERNAKQNAESPEQSSSPRVEGLTREDIEEIVRQSTGGLTLEMIQFLKERFEQDQIRQQRTEKRAKGSQINLLEELLGILEGRSSDANVKPSEVLPEREEKTTQEGSPSTSVTSADGRRIAELEEKLEAQEKRTEAHKQETKANKQEIAALKATLEQILKNQQENPQTHEERQKSRREQGEKQAGDGRCCVVS